MPDIQAQTPDGVTHSFPDGTSPDVITGAIKKYLGVGTAPRPSEAQQVANRPSKVAPIPDPGERADSPLGKLAQGQEAETLGNKEAGDWFLKHGPVELGQGAQEFTSHGPHAVGSHPYAHAFNRMVSGAAVTALPAAANLLPMAAVEAPAATALSLGTGAAAQAGVEKGGELLGADPEVAKAAGNVAGIVGASLGPKIPELPGAVQIAKEDMGRAFRVQPTVENTNPSTGTLGKPKAFNTLKPGVKAVASVGKLIGGQQVANAVIPDYPEPIGPFRRLSTGPIPDEPVRAVEPSGGSDPGRGPNAVNLLPEPRNTVPSDRPGSMWSIKRTKQLPAAAARATPGAGEVLQNIGKPVIYIPRGADIETPALPQEPVKLGAQPENPGPTLAPRRPAPGDKGPIRPGIRERYDPEGKLTDEQIESKARGEQEGTLQNIAGIPQIMEGKGTAVELGIPSKPKPNEPIFSRPIANPRETANPKGMPTRDIAAEDVRDYPAPMPSEEAPATPPGREKVGKFDADTLSEAKEAVAAAHEQWSQFERPGRYVINANEEMTINGPAKPDLQAYGVQSARPQIEAAHPWIKNLPKLTSGKLRAAVESGKGVEYNRLLNEAAGHIQRNKEAAAPVLDEFRGQLEEAASNVEKKDPHLAQTLRDLAAGKYAGIRGHTEYLREKLNEAATADDFDKIFSEPLEGPLSEGAQELGPETPPARESNQQAAELGPPKKKTERSGQ